MMQLRAENLVKTYRERTVVRGVSLAVSQGEVVGLLGPNGAGKTTTFRLMVGLTRPDTGNVYLEETCITALPLHKRAQKGIGYLPQEVSIFRDLTVEENLMAVLEMTNLSRKAQNAQMEHLLQAFDIEAIRKQRGRVLSGGERRRTEIARALAISPKFLLLDEPFAGIDPIAVEEMQLLITKLKRQHIGILITDHNVRETLSITDRAYLMFEGKVLKSGTASALAEDEAARRVYLGKRFELKNKV